MADDPKLIDKLYSQSPPIVASLIRCVASAADGMELHAWLVGGMVRDIMLGIPSLDIDVVTEGDARSLAAVVVEGHGGRITGTSRFGTVQLQSGGCSLDIATTRSETYRSPGALPIVTPSTLDDDLRRRDFTCNAIALALNGRDRGSIIDPTRGQADVSARVIKVIHPGSFRDDATRMLRAVRYEQRLGFALDAMTESLLRRDLAYLAAISGTRIRREVERTMREPRPELAFQRMYSLGILQAIASGLRFDEAQLVAIERARELPGVPAGAQWPILCWAASGEEAAEICSRLALTRVQRDSVLALAQLRGIEATLRTSPRVSEWTGILEGFPVASVAALACISGSNIVRGRILDYLQRHRRVKPNLTGDDLLSLGVPSGPTIGTVLARLKSGVLDGELRTRAEEEALVKALLAEVVWVPAG